MLRSYKFYEENLSIGKEEVDKIYQVICNLESKLTLKSYDEKEIRNLGCNTLLMMVLEDKVDLLKKVSSLFPYNDKGVVRYRYLLDIISVRDFLTKLKSLTYEEILDKSVYEDILNYACNVDYEKAKGMKIRDVLAREISGMGHPIVSKRDVAYYSELPVLKSALECFAKNIITSSNDTEGCYTDGDFDSSKLHKVVLSINYDTLSESNKLVADSLIESGKAEFGRSFINSKEKDLFVFVNVSCEETVEEASNKLLNLFSQFTKQDMIYGRISINDIKERMNHQVFLLSDDEYEKVVAIVNKGWNSENVLKALEFFHYIYCYYDREEDQFWLNEYYCQCHKKFLADQPNQDSSFKK